MNVHIQSQSNNHISVFIDMYEYASESSKIKAIRCAEITKSKPSIYLGGYILFNNDKIIFEHVRKFDFKEKGVDFKIFETLIKNNLNFLINYKQNLSYHK